MNISPRKLDCSKATKLEVVMGEESMVMKEEKESVVMEEEKESVVRGSGQQGAPSSRKIEIKGERKGEETG